MAIDKITTAAITDGTITTAKLAYEAAPFRNIIINGDMSIAQRGTSFTGLGDTDSQYTLDRFKWSEEGSSGTAEFTITQSTDVPTGQGFTTSLKLDCTTADTSIDSGNIIQIEQRVEGQNLQYLKYGTSSAESTTLSFWVKSNSIIPSVSVPTFVLSQNKRLGILILGVGNSKTSICIGNEG